MASKNDATVLSFEKKLVFSDGFLYGTTWNTRAKDKAIPLNLHEKSVRGTIANRLSAKNDADSKKLTASIENPNIQTVDHCSLAEGHDTLKLKFTLKVLGGIEKPSASNGPMFNEHYPKVAKTYIKEHGFKELALRYAINIANGRYLWRNRVGADQIEILVSIGDERLKFDGKAVSLKNFEVSDPNIQILADKIAAALRGEIPYLLIQVEAFALIGYAQEVYPSEELIMDKGKGKKSKVLYHVDQVAALHSQKIGNAIRTIDTWYSDYPDANYPIAIESYGAVTSIGKAYREPKSKTDFYTLFDKYALGGDISTHEKHYVMAMLVRGGVFGVKSKDKD